MGFAESNASRRALLGQLAGQLSEATQRRAAQKGQTADIFAGYGQQALGMFGEKRLETQRQAGRMELTGEESRLRMGETEAEHGLMATREKDLEDLVQQGRLTLAEKNKALRFEEWEDSLDYLAGKLDDDYMRAQWGYAPIGRGEGEDPLAQLRQPSVYSAWAFSEYLRKEGLDPSLQKLPQEERDQYVKFAMDMLTADYPDMPDWEKASFQQAFLAQATGVQPEEEEVGGGKPGLSDTDAPGRRARGDQMTAMVPDLKKKKESLHKGDPQRAIIDRLLAETHPQYHILDLERTFNDWMRRVREAIGSALMPTHEPFEPLQEQLRSMYEEHPR